MGEPHRCTLLHLASIPGLALCIATSPVFANTCVDASGSWNGTEAGSFTCTAAGETETFAFNESLYITINQTGCTASYEVPGSGVIGGVSRTLSLSGSSITASGEFLFALPGYNVTFTRNQVNLSGSFGSINNASVSGTGQAAGTIEGIPFTCTGSSTANIYRAPPLQDSDGDLVAEAADNCPTVANFSQLDTDADGRGDALNRGLAARTGVGARAAQMKAAGLGADQVQ